MAFNEELAERIRAVLPGRLDLTERRMFGGLAFLIDGNMCCGIVGDNLCVRLGKEGTAAGLKEPHTRPMDFTGKPLGTMLYVSPDGIEERAALEAWVRRAVEFTRTLPPK